MAIQLSKPVVGGYTGDHWALLRISVAETAQAATTPTAALYRLFMSSASKGSSEDPVADHRSVIILDMTAITATAGQFEQLIDDAAITQDPFFSGGSHV